MSRINNLNLIIFGYFCEVVFNYYVQRHTNNIIFIIYLIEINYN